MLELGCGLGLLGTCLYRIGASPLMLTDGDARTVANCCSNLRLNGVPAVLLMDPAASPGGRVDLDPMPSGGCTDLDPRGRATLDSAVTTGAVRATGRSRVQCRRLQWGPLSQEEGTCSSEGGGACSASAMPSPRPDVILGADLLYDPGRRCMRPGDSRQCLSLLFHSHQYLPLHPTFVTNEVHYDHHVVLRCLLACM